MNNQKEGAEKMIIAVDFDGTLCIENYPNIGEANTDLINALIARRRAGDKLILWTCREEMLLENAVAWCKQQGLEFDAVNDNLEEVKIKYQHNSRKITADIYIDDKARGLSAIEMYLNRRCV
jgi:hypothetical protein